MKEGDIRSENESENNRTNTLNATLSVHIERSSNDIETTDWYCADLTDCIDRETAVLFTVEKTVKWLIYPNRYRSNRKKSRPCRPLPLTRQHEHGDAVTMIGFI